MSNTDQMNYTFEQLVRALAIETMEEVLYNETNQDFNFVEANNKWDGLAETVLEEIKILFEGTEIHPYGRKADEAIVVIKSLLEPYSTYPTSHKLMNSIEKIAGQKCDSDPRPYIKLIVRALDSTSINDWFNKRTIK